MFPTKEKKERSLGVKLFLKPERCNSPKCVTVRRPQHPGLHGKMFRRQLSEFGLQLKEKQKIRFTYGIRERHFRKIFQSAAKNPGVTGQMIFHILEKRLDNVVYRLGLAPSRSVARQLVGHGHIMVNNRKVTIPSFQVKVGELISIRQQSKEHPAFKELANSLKKYDPPIWLAMDSEKFQGKVLSEPKDLEIPFDVNLVVDYYSK
ncbi:MAG: 30S ribosomal protein S4 [Candidatus Harrisonbacteria bacterium RIFCSPLOWO2_02_FULL_41_13b]|uniref:Small ribosomal subunit protein uS4 n=1 Tax=Candidatus Harrisonbacteria bacterium RIFCSPLOWO2_02_FULL_41_13b TaxID=1798409 RepID=A0A1G1ZQH4_9BACT|nr:MAG: 30S ribosomal protein S4 [Candidatus Harrisonbacteria bacterium RIFCSPHIGHO2_02_FULL_40_20]OGY66874.1 MAG: 30S ribosomal protein S4 [Candidatus Harrisonbacteria bacterium RIFCSPLOWO2_02_FULL_41_13b]